MIRRASMWRGLLIGTCVALCVGLQACRDSGGGESGGGMSPVCDSNTTLCDAGRSPDGANGGNGTNGSNGGSPNGSGNDMAGSGGANGGANGSGAADGAQVPPATCLGAATPDAPLDPKQCGSIIDPTLAEGVLVDGAAPAAGNGSFAHPFTTLDEAVAAVSAAYTAGKSQTKIYLVRRDTAYSYAASTTKAIAFPFELYGGFFPLGPEQYGRQLDAPSAVELPNGLLMGMAPFRLDGVSVTTQRITVLNAPITIVSSRVSSYLQNTDAELLRYIVWFKATGALTITDSVLTHLGSAANHVIALDMNVLNVDPLKNAQVTIARSQISAGDSTGVSYGVRFYRPINFTKAPFNVTMNDATISAGSGTGSVALLCGEKADDLSAKLGKSYGIDTVTIERSTVQAGTASLHRSLALGLYNATQPAVIRNSVLVGGKWDAANPPALATALESRHSSVVLVNNTLRDGDFIMAVQLPSTESLILRNNIIAPWEGGWGVFLDPNGPGAATFLFTDLTNNLFATTTSALGYNLFYHPKTGALTCKEAACPGVATTLNQAKVDVTGGGNLVTAVQFAGDGSQLAAGASAIDAGAPLTPFGAETAADLAVDRAGIQRQGPPDIGAYEWVPTP